MARAIIGGLVGTGFDAKSIIVFDPNQELVNGLVNDFGIHVASTNTNAVEFKALKDISGYEKISDVVVLAVKPQIMKMVAEGLSSSVQSHKPLIVSIAAGIRIDDLDQWLGGNVSIVRTMPNTPALVGEGATALYANKVVTKVQKEAADSILGAISSKKYWVETEQLLDVVTGLSGSGPAYFFLLIESIEEAAVSLGLPVDIARGLAIQTCLGAGKMASTSDCDPAELRRRVTSPNGTTEAAIVKAEELGMRNLWLQAVTAATKRSEELGAAMSK